LELKSREGWFFPSLGFCETTEELVHAAGQSERRKNLVYLRKALEQKPREGWFFPSIGFCETTEEIGSVAREEARLPPTDIGATPTQKVTLFQLLSGIE
jgi:hypothetical protein